MSGESQRCAVLVQVAGAIVLAFLVMLVKLGSLVEFQFGPAVVAFVLCVALSMVASLSFDPHAIWSDNDQTEDAEQS